MIRVISYELRVTSPDVVSRSLTAAAKGHLSLIAVPEGQPASRSPVAVPEGHLRLAQRFNVGCGRARGVSPEGTADGRDGQRKYTPPALHKPLPGCHSQAKRRKRRAPML
jgi:hypothetical protein